MSTAEHSAMDCDHDEHRTVRITSEWRALQYVLALRLHEQTHPGDGIAEACVFDCMPKAAELIAEMEAAQRLGIVGETDVELMRELGGQAVQVTLASFEEHHAWVVQELLRRNQAYGRASHTIGQQRAHIKRLQGEIERLRSAVSEPNTDPITDECAAAEGGESMAEQTPAGPARPSASQGWLSRLVLGPVEGQYPPVSCADAREGHTELCRRLNLTHRCDGSCVTEGVPHCETHGLPVARCGYCPSTAEEIADALAAEGGDGRG